MTATGSSALIAWLSGRSLTTSTILRTELVRAANRRSVAVAAAARASLSQLVLLPVTDEVLDRAAQLQSPSRAPSTPSTWRRPACSAPSSRAS